MIGWLSGIVRLRDPLTGIVVLDCGGVGYQLTVSWQTFAHVPEEGETCSLWVHTHAREDVLALYGFATREERQMYLLLTSVPQVGPRLAISVLGGVPLLELLDAIAQADRATLERIPGVGKRTAERILLDLKEKVERLRPAEAPDREAKPAATDPSDATARLVEEARAVLVNLGWKPRPVDLALERAQQDDPSPTELDALVRRSLALLMSG